MLHSFEKKWSKKYKLDPCSNFRDFIVTLQLKLQTSNFPKGSHRISIYFSLRLVKLTTSKLQGKIYDKIEKSPEMESL